MIGWENGVPSATPVRLQKLPAARLRMITSTIRMSTLRTSTLVSSIWRTKCVGTPSFSRKP
jgi:hypothetical protein